MANDRLTLFLIHTLLLITTLWPGLRPSLSHQLILFVLILYMSGGTYSFHSYPYAKFFEKHFTATSFTLAEGIFLFISFCFKCLNRALDNWLVSSTTTNYRLSYNPPCDRPYQIISMTANAYDAQLIKIVHRHIHT